MRRFIKKLAHTITEIKKLPSGSPCAREPVRVTKSQKSEVSESEADGIPSSLRPKTYKLSEGPSGKCQSLETEGPGM